MVDPMCAIDRPVFAEALGAVLILARDFEFEAPSFNRASFDDAKGQYNLMGIRRVAGHTPDFLKRLAVYACCSGAGAC